MNVQVLASVMNQNIEQIAENMNLSSEAVIINQCDHDAYEEREFRGHMIKFYSINERGIGRSRNNAIERADSDICLFSDEDIEYIDGYEEKIVKEFEANPQADMILFNIDVEESRRTYYITERSRVKWYNCGRYGAVSFAIRRESLIQSGVRFSLLFGGGAKYSNGEDSLFLKQFMDKGFKVFTAPVLIGREKPSDSTWFAGYNEKFFHDRGVLYAVLYGMMAIPFALRFLIAHRRTMCVDNSILKAFGWMCKGIHEGKKLTET